MYEGILIGADFLLQPNEYYMMILKHAKTRASGREPAFESCGLAHWIRYLQFAEYPGKLKSSNRVPEAVESCTCNENFSLLQISDSGSDPLDRKTRTLAPSQKLLSSPALISSYSIHWAVAGSRLPSNKSIALCRPCENQKPVILPAE